MKKISVASTIVALALTVTPLAAFAEETNAETKPVTDPATSAPETELQPNITNEMQSGEKPAEEAGKGSGSQPASTNPAEKDRQKPAREIEMAVDYMLIPYLIDDETFTNGLYVSARLVNGKKIKGTWTVEVVGGEKKTFKNKAKIESEIKLGDGKSYTVYITFTDGKGLELKKSIELTVPFLGAEFKVENGKQVFKGTIGNGKQATGNWHFFVGNEEDLVAQKEQTNVKGTSVSQEFNLKPGKYVGIVMFEGEVDGVDMVLGADLEIEVKANGQGSTKPVKDEQKPVVMDPEKAKEEIQQAQKGGKMPKTATSYPMGAAAGLALLASGAALMVRNRRVG